jgi:hypothetical protein
MQAAEPQTHGIQHEGSKGAKVFLGMARVMGHGVTRKSTERESKGMARVIGHGMTRKSTGRESKGMARVGFTTKTRRARSFCRALSIISCDDRSGAARAVR